MSLLTAIDGSRDIYSSKPPEGNSLYHDIHQACQLRCHRVQPPPSTHNYYSDDEGNNKDDDEDVHQNGRIHIHLHIKNDRDGVGLRQYFTSRNNAD